MDYKALKGLVLKKYFSIGAFANDIGWSRNKSSRIVNGIQNPSVDDIVDLTKSLELDEPTFFNIFLKTCPQCVQSRFEVKPNKAAIRQPNNERG